MRKFLVVVAVVALLAVVPMPTGAQEVPCCKNAATGQIVKQLLPTCEELGPGWVPFEGPCDGDSTPGWWDAILAWADGKVIYSPDGPQLAKILAILASFVAIVQAIKKFIEGSGKWQWLLKLIPGWAKIAAALTSTWVPMVLNALVTGGVMLTAAFQTPGLTAGEVLRIILAIVGTDLLYRLIRDWLPLFGKGAATK